MRFRVPPVGRFDSALVPTGPAGAPCNAWLFVVETSLPIGEQVALYGHTVGHLLLNRELQQMGQLPPLDPRDGFVHADSLAELHLLESIRRPVDRRVLEAYPMLAELLRVRDERPAAVEYVVAELRQRLSRSGWPQHLIEVPYVFTAGRVYVSGTAARRGQRLRADALLRYETSLPIALVQTLRPGEVFQDAAQRLTEYARHRLALPFAYLVDDHGNVHEFDCTAPGEPGYTARTALPERDELWRRWVTVLSLTDTSAQQALCYPYQASGPKPRYYQEVAINRAVIAVLQARRGLRQPHILLNLATGTGKTKVAFQMVWKLKRAREIRQVLFLTDRDYLLGQAMDNEFAPFGDARDRIQGAARTSRDILFATYQAIAPDEHRAGLYRDYPRDFFDLVIVDECHRGSAQDDSNWREILTYFTSAVQVGLTATPLRTDNAQTYTYFGDPVSTYALRVGINDGFLAPYRVRRVLLRKVEDSMAPDVARQDSEGDESVSVAEAVQETAGTLVASTETIAQHLAGYLRQTDPMAKTIVFCVDQPHAKQMREALLRACSEHVARYPDYVERMVSDEGSEGKRALGRFSTPSERTPVIATTSKLLGTGVDLPTCKNIVLARPIHSMVEFKQIIGRGTRLFEPDKLWFTILDYAGATRLFFDHDFDGDPELVEIEPLTPEVPAEQPTPDGTSVVQAAPVTGTVGSREQEAQPDASPPAVPTPLSSAVPAEPPPPLYLPDVSPTADASSLGMPDEEQEPVETAGSPFAEGSASAASGQLGNPSTPGVLSPPPQVVTVTRPRDGQQFRVAGEIIYELAPDGKTLRQISLRDYTVAALQGLVQTEADLRAHWLVKEQQAEIIARLVEEGVDLQALAASQHLHNTDPLDVLLHVAFGQAALTRQQRAERVWHEHAEFFGRYSPAAREILDTILQKYVDCDAADVSDTELLKVPPLSEQGTFIELARHFGGGAAVRAALKELQTLLYTI
jgi:type I restriction enzyme R subunit